MISSQKTVKCSRCDGEAWLWVGARAPQSQQTLCSNCRKVEREKLETEQNKLTLERLEKELPEAIQSQRWLWENQSNLPGRFCCKTLANFDSRLQPKAFEVINKWYGWGSELVDEQPPSSILLLSPGVYGVGKTHLLAGLVNKLIETTEAARINTRNLSILKHPCPVYFTTEVQMLARIRDTFNKGRDEKGETERDIYKQLEDEGIVLLIDDVGKVKPRDQSFLQSVYFRVIDSRYANELPIIMTTNLDYKQLEEHIGGACADRLREMCGKNILVMKGKSYRTSI